MELVEQVAELEQVIEVEFVIELEYVLALEHVLALEQGLLIVLMSIAAFALGVLKRVADSCQA